MQKWNKDCDLSRVSGLAFRVLLVEDAMRMDGVGPQGKVFQVNDDLIPHFSSDQRAQEPEPSWLGHFSAVRGVRVLFIHCFLINTAYPICTSGEEIRSFSVK